MIFLLLKKDKVPKIMLIGNKTDTVYQNETYNDPGYTAIYSDGSKYKGDVNVSSNVDVNHQGTYKIFYTILDKNRVISSTKRTVIVVENPLDDVKITLNGEQVQYVIKGEPYQEKGANRNMTSVEFMEQEQVRERNSLEYRLVKCLEHRLNQLATKS